MLALKEQLKETPSRERSHERSPSHPTLDNPLHRTVGRSQTMTAQHAHHMVILVFHQLGFIIAATHQKVTH